MDIGDLYLLTDEHMERLRSLFPESHGQPRVDDRRVLSGIIFVNRNDLRRRDAPKDYGPAKTIAGADSRTFMIDATYLKAHRTASSLTVKKGGLGHLIDRTKGSINNKLYAVAGANGRPLSFFLTAGPVSDYIGVAALLDELPKA